MAYSSATVRRDTCAATPASNQGSATRSRSGITRTCSLLMDNESLRGLQFGGFNLRVDVTFEDRVVWIARFRLFKINLPSDEKVNFDQVSEVATYRLQQKISIPVPIIHDFAQDGEVNNSVRVGYNLMEKLLRKPMNWYVATIDQKQHVFLQLWDIYLEIEKISKRGWEADNGV